MRLVEQLGNSNKTIPEIKVPFRCDICENSNVAVQDGLTLCLYHWSSYAELADKKIKELEAENFRLREERDSFQRVGIIAETKVQQLEAENALRLLAVRTGSK